MHRLPQSSSSSLTLTLALAMAAVLCAFPSHLPALAWMGCTVTRSWARVQDHRTQQKQNVVFGTFFFACLFALLHRYFLGFFCCTLRGCLTVLQLTNKNSAHSPTDKHKEHTQKFLHTTIIIIAQRSSCSAQGLKALDFLDRPGT